MSCKKDTATVRYRPIPNFPLYCVGDDGSFWSKKNSVNKETPKWRRLKLHIKRTGYYCVSLTDNGKVYQKILHRVILEAFCGPAPTGYFGCHFPDRCTTNNRLENLRWAPPCENSADMLKHGTSAKGIGHGMAKLTDSQVLEIKKMTKDGYTAKKIAAKYKIGRTTVYRIKHKQAWTHVLGN